MNRARPWGGDSGRVVICISPLFAPGTSRQHPVDRPFGFRFCFFCVCPVAWCGSKAQTGWRAMRGRSRDRRSASSLSSLLSTCDVMPSHALLLPVVQELDLLVLPLVVLLDGCVGGSRLPPFWCVIRLLSVFRQGALRLMARSHSISIVLPSCPHSSAATPCHCARASVLCAVIVAVAPCCGGLRPGVGMLRGFNPLAGLAQTAEPHNEPIALGVRLRAGAPGPAGERAFFALSPLLHSPKQLTNSPGLKRRHGQLF